MPTFIKLTMYNGEPLYLNVNHVVSFHEYEHYSAAMLMINTVITTVESEDYYMVCETVDKVASMIGACQ